MPIASLESSSALEFYHNQLKIRFLNDETDSDIYKRADWLVNKLSTKIHSYFWFDEYEGKDGFSRYWKDEWATDFNSWRKSRTIPNTDVMTESERVEVVDRVDQDLYHEIWNPGSEYAICSCEWGEKGNLCEHVCKVIQYHREKGSILPSISLLQYSRCLINMLKCPPANSLIHDDAVSLAVWVNAQLSAQFARRTQNGVSGGEEPHRSGGTYQSNYLTETALEESCISKGRETVESFDSLMEHFVECKDFMDYFKAIWYPRIGSWITALKTMPIASHESSAALEFYHNQIKIRFLNNETNSDIYKRADSLVNKLSTKIHSYFWLDEYEGKDGFSRYWKDEWATDFNSWRKSRTIPNTDVITEGERVKVVDRVDRDLYHEIWNPGLSMEFVVASGEKRVTL
ncbi:zinc ion binding protein [Tanacetum coccineum]